MINSPGVAATTGVDKNAQELATSIIARSNSDQVPQKPI